MSGMMIIGPGIAVGVDVGAVERNVQLHRRQSAMMAAEAYRRDLEWLLPQLAGLGWFDPQEDREEGGEENAEPSPPPSPLSEHKGEGATREGASGP